MLPGGDVFPEDAGSIAERRAAGSRVRHAPAGTSTPGPRCVRMVGHDSCFHSAKNPPEAAATPKAMRASRVRVRLGEGSGGQDERLARDLARGLVRVCGGGGGAVGRGSKASA